MRNSTPCRFFDYTDARLETRVVSKEENTSTSPRPSLDRRRSHRIRLDFETAVPVILRSASGQLRWGVARNVSEGGMLIEMEDPPPIGEAIEVEIGGIRGSMDSPETVALVGEVRHHVAWNFKADGKRGKTRLSAIGVRFFPYAAGKPLH